MSEQKSNRRLWKVLAVVAVVGLLIGAFAATGVLASLFDTTSVVENKFETVDLSNEIHVIQHRSVGDQYTVANDGNLPVYVRLKVVMNWVDESGNPMMYPPEGTYDLKIGANWTQLSDTSDPQDGYWYYNKILEPGEETDPLITKITVDGGEIELTLLAETIQMNPEKAVSDAWGMQYQNGKWTKVK